MPYIDPDRRKELDLDPWDARTPGELSYVITIIVSRYIYCKLHYCGKQTDKLNYALLNEVVGVLESTKLEFYRRMVMPYETEKEKINGDVY